MSSKIIALSGWKGSGKDTAADHLIGKGYKRYAFADILKEMVAEQYGIPLEMLHKQELKEQPLTQYPVDARDKFSEAIHQLLAGEFREGCWTPRALAILEGSIKRSVNSSYWVNRVATMAKKDHSPVVITDLRYRSEAELLSNIFGNDLSLVRINRFEDSPSTDPSERDLDDFNFKHVINNTGTLTELYEQVEKVINEAD